MDTATHQCNDGHYLDQHLKAVLAAQARSGDIDIHGLGVGLDLGVFYRSRLALDLSQPLDDAMLHAIATLLACRTRH